MSGLLFGLGYVLVLAGTAEAEELATPVILLGLLLILAAAALERLDDHSDRSTSDNERVQPTETEQ